MTSSEKTSSVLSALSKAQAAMGPVQKGGENKFDRYRYAMLGDFVAVAHEPMAANGLSLISEIVEIIDLPARETKNGGVEYVVRVKLSMRLIHGPTAEWIELVAWGEGQDRADKSCYKAVTGARKYGIACLFGLATTDDPEQDDAKPVQQERAVIKDKPLTTPREEIQPAKAKPAKEPVDPDAPEKPWEPSSKLFQTASVANDAAAWTKISLDYKGARSKMSEAHARQAWSWIVKAAKNKGFAWEQESKVFVPLEEDQIDMTPSPGPEKTEEPKAEESVI